MKNGKPASYRFLILLLLLAGWLAACNNTHRVEELAPPAGPAAPVPTNSAIPSPGLQLVAATATATQTAAVATAAPTATLTPPPTALPTPTVPAEILIEAPQATLPAGFSIIKFADLYRPTSLAFGPNGALYATSFDGTLHRFVDADGDGRAEEDIIFARGFDTPLGVEVAANGEVVYVSSMGKISRLRDANGDRVADEVTALVTGLPVGRHQNDNLKFGPDGLLYMGVGSTCDACEENDPRSASIMRFDPESGAGEVYATGMRNPYDLAFHPETGELFATDNGRDDLGLDAPSEELNHIREGEDYGWPGCWDRLQGPACAGTVPAIAFFEPHSSANSLDFYRLPQQQPGMGFPVAYTNSLFVAILGSWLKDGVETGIAWAPLHPTPSGYEARVSWFARWEGMPLGLVSGPDGALYVGDYVNGAVFRISYGLP